MIQHILLYDTKLQKICQLCKAILCIVYNILQTKLCNFTKFRTLFQAVPAVIFFPISIFLTKFRLKVKGKAHYNTRFS